MNLRASSFACLAIVASLCMVLTASCGRSNLDGYTLADGDAGIDASLDADADADASGEGGSCNATTCPTGCCDARGRCAVGLGIHACGAGGERCADCQAEGFAVCDANLHVCANTTKSCNAKTCPTGCCEGDLCVPGTDPNECGASGAACQHCAQQGQSCQNKACTSAGCGPMTCKGCCFGGMCESGLDQTACGFGGEQCQNCQAQSAACAPNAGGGTCAGPAKCDATNCKGCCQNDVCVGGSQINACGFGGVVCQDCSTLGAICNFQQCELSTCGPANCPNGCCDANGQCQMGGDVTACGAGGKQCQDCAALGESCANGVCQNTSCGPASCPSGCCSNGFCVGGASNSACGVGGVACMDCAGSNLACQSGQCVPPPPLCSPRTCPNGCCFGNVCAVGTGDNACGTGGAQCQSCSSIGEVCSSGTCVKPPPTCNASTCPNGCCVGDVCAVGTQNGACGTGGSTCADCTSKNATCQGGRCVANPPTCTPQNCSGCCDATGTCQPGFLNSQCGENGATCADCSSQGSTCDTSVTPRVCSGQQATCPAPYASCPAGVTTPQEPIRHVCSSSDLANARAACSGGAHTAACQSFLQFEQQQKPACAKCLTPFDYDFQEAEGLFICVAPFVSASCDHRTGCAIDCETQSCSQCPSGSVSQCEQQVRSGQCRQYLQQSQCVAQAFFSSGAFCNPQNYGGNYGAWLQGVGGHYCGP